MLVGALERLFELLLGKSKLLRADGFKLVVALDHGRGQGLLAGRVLHGEAAVELALV